MDDDFEIRPLTPDDGAAFTRCMNEGHRHLRGDGLVEDRAPEQFEWQFVDNPAGTLRGYGAFADGRLVAVYVVAPVRFKIRDEVGLAAQSLDTMTLPEARGKKLFTRLATLTYAAMAEEGRVLFTYGFPNEASTPGFRKYLDWSFLEPLPRFVRPLDVSPALRKVSPGLDLRIPVPSLRALLSSGSGRSARRVSVVPEDADLLWEDFSSTFDFGLVRDARFLRWRYERKPGTDYVFFEDRPGSGRLAGFGVVAIEDKPFGRVCQVMDVVVGDGAAATAVLKAIAGYAREAGASALQARYPGDRHPLREAYGSAGYLRVPRLISPMETRVGFVTHGARAAESLDLTGGRWFFSQGDSDYH